MDLNKEFSNFKLNSNNEPKEPIEVGEVNQALRGTLESVSSLLKEKNDKCFKQEKQIEALTIQVKSLKDVVLITKDLLNIRNIEVNHLKEDIESMQSVINSERDRHNQIIEKMERAIQINQQLKEEYQNQLKLFTELKMNYEKKLEVLAKENERLQNLQKTITNGTKN